MTERLTEGTEGLVPKEGVDASFLKFAESILAIYNEKQTYTIYNSEESQNKGTTKKCNRVNRCHCMHLIFV